VGYVRAIHQQILKIKRKTEHPTQHAPKYPGMIERAKAHCTQRMQGCSSFNRVINDVGFIISKILK
jgi:hypothetical protein